MEVSILVENLTLEQAMNVAREKAGLGRQLGRCKGTDPRSHRNLCLYEVKVEGHWANEALEI